MNTHDIQEVESVSRSIARWASAAAAILFGVAFVTDQTLTWRLVSGAEAVRIVLILGIFFGYALALTKRFEVLGSVVALVAICAIYGLSAVSDRVPPAPIFLVVGAPALFHLVAVALHRFALLPRKATEVENQ